LTQEIFGISGYKPEQGLEVKHSLWV